MNKDTDMITDMLDYGCYLYDAMAEAGEVNFREWWRGMVEYKEDLKRIRKETE